MVKKSQVYLENDKRERKATGSYYTPDYIVQYIVEHSVGPVLQEEFEAMRPKLREAQQRRRAFFQKQEALRKQHLKPEPESKADFIGQELVDEIFNIKVLDPAMGSGHFLVEAVDYITDKALDFLNAFPWNPVVAYLARMRETILREMDEQGVTIDAKRLTDVNLLKRHVLKRCIYGVDLNPMAVELAKVSLWLDCFTLGAPLSFLDHHLRCGNSLIGVTVDEVNQASQTGQLTLLSGNRFAGMKQAVAGMIHIGELSDVTAAQVQESRLEYRRASDALKPAKRLLDVYTSQWFGNTPKMLGHGKKRQEYNYAFEFLRDVASEHWAEKPERTKLPKEWEEVASTTLHAANEKQFFHWELEFPEVFYGPRPGTTQAIERLEGAGFDAVIGNPPYVRMELIKPFKPFLKRLYQCHAERADLFIYFYERAVALLREGGLSAFIASSTWTKTDAGTGLREFLKLCTTIRSYIDFGDLPIFPEATTYPCVMVFRRNPAPTTHTIASLLVNDLAETDLVTSLRTRATLVPQAQLEPNGWRFEDLRLARLREKICDAGVSLKDYCGSPLYGIKTGLNEAFVIDTETRDAFIAEDKRNIEILKPFLEGKDLKPWRAEWRGLWLIYTHHGIDIRKYSAILDYLKQFKTDLEKRATADHHRWYELQQPQFAYSSAMEKPKIMYPDITAIPKFVYDDTGFYFGNTTYFIPAADRYLQGLLSSNLLWWYLTSSVRQMRGGYLRLFSQYIERQPILRCSAVDKRVIASLVEQLSTDVCPNQLALEAELNDRVYRLYGLTEEEIAIVERRE
ncbi:MAG: Eco57I restriction-modification methylase domain-containing protein [Deltaproteobacteria bacterium]|nr:Eco57I restriction-modification methylase domain-containing protein [Deltaproteobacteria bacterium]